MIKKYEYIYTYVYMIQIVKSMWVYIYAFTEKCMYKLISILAF